MTHIERPVYRRERTHDNAVRHRAAEILLRTARKIRTTDPSFHFVDPSAREDAGRLESAAKRLNKANTKAAIGRVYGSLLKLANDEDQANFYVTRDAARKAVDEIEGLV